MENTMYFEKEIEVLQRHIDHLGNGRQTEAVLAAIDCLKRLGQVAELYPTEAEGHYAASIPALIISFLVVARARVTGDVLSSYLLFEQAEQLGRAIFDDLYEGRDDFTFPQKEAEA